MYISAVKITGSYLECCDYGWINPNQYFIVRRSRVWDLADPKERKEAALAFLGCLNYNMHGDD
jgi:hypothetical protein